MTVEVVWSNVARDELLAIYLTIGLENPSAAERIYDRIEERARQLAEQPRMGPRRPDIHASARVLVEAPYLILYETVPDTDDGPVTRVEIVTVVDGRRSLTDAPF
ncbi:type II toxin-antitoxin system RelE/ParE family toxin [Methylobacterium oryzisoli]|uniref:type II toxin-antitoxin system RelE/ParE family toxin n=1 Tax=Methylobacterium oryzisoli TaxID=3385502 RepID=UPI00389255A9